MASFADELRGAGHTVHTPDLFEGRTFATLEDGMAHAREVGFGTLLERGVAAGEELSSEGAVYAGFSLGVMPAQQLAQTRPGAHAALFAHSCVPPSEFGRGWPDGVPLQLHLTEDDPLALPPNTDLEAARALAEGGAELFLYPGTDHLFDAPTTALFTERALAFLERRHT